MTFIKALLTAHAQKFDSVARNMADNCLYTVWLSVSDVM